jgi:hypothetical protein
MLVVMRSRQAARGCRGRSVKYHLATWSSVQEGLLQFQSYDRKHESCVLVCYKRAMSELSQKFQVSAKEQSRQQGAQFPSKEPPYSVSIAHLTSLQPKMIDCGPRPHVRVFLPRLEQSTTATRRAEGATNADFLKSSQEVRQ